MSNALRKCTILIVDDTPENIHILYDTLKSDYEIIAAADGRMALEILASKNPPDLILLDIMMPDIDGYEVCIRVKSNPKTESIPIIFITAMGEEEDEAMGLALGAVDYIIKPFKPDIIKARIRNHIEVKRHRDRLEALIRNAESALPDTETGNKTKHTFPAKMSHNLRMPLNVIIEHSNRLIDTMGNQDDKRFIPDLKIINGAGKYLLSLVDDILNVSRIQ